MAASRFLLFRTSFFRTSITTLSPPPLLLLPKTFHSLRFLSHSASAAVGTIAADTPETLGSPHPYHPWPEWVAFVDGLKTKGYFIEEAPLKDVYKDLNLLKDPCLSFARDRYDVFKSLSTRDIKTVVEGGCPNILRKVVNSAKRLRAHVRLDEGDVCSACNLRGSCDRAYVILKDSEAAARTLDIVRLLLFYALDPLVTSGKKPPGRELVESSARKLLSEFVELIETSPDPALPRPVTKASRQKGKSLDLMEDDEMSKNVEMKRGDWMCPKCNFLNFSRNICCLKCKEDGPKRVDVDDVEMKKGDWICPECSFMNFSRNIQCIKCKAVGPKRAGVDDIQMRKGDWNCTQCGFMNFASNKKCLGCREQRPKRQLNPGEWECPSCDFLNYRRNKVCLRCNGERPQKAASGYEEQIWRRPQ